MINTYTYSYMRQEKGKCCFHIVLYSNNVNNPLLMLCVFTCHPCASIHTAACPSLNINYPPMRTSLCPGDTITTYTCGLSSKFLTVTTLWSGSGFQCTPIGLTANAITLTQSHPIQQWYPLCCDDQCQWDMLHLCPHHTYSAIFQWTHSHMQRHYWCYC